MKRIFKALLFIMWGTIFASEFRDFKALEDVFKGENYEQIKQLFKKRSELSSAAVMACIGKELFFVTYRRDYKCPQQLLKECEDGSCNHKKGWEENLTVKTKSDDDQLAKKKSFMLQLKGDQVVASSIEE